MEVDLIGAPKLHPIGLEVTSSIKNIFGIPNLSDTIGGSEIVKDPIFSRISVFLNDLITPMIFGATFKDDNKVPMVGIGMDVGDSTSIWLKTIVDPTIIAPRTSTTPKNVGFDVKVKATDVTKAIIMEE